MQDTTDLLQIKIENAKKQLSEDTLNAISAVPWQGEIIKMRETKGYTFEQLGDLELETELLLCGLISPEDYPKELKNRMGISETGAKELVEEMNKLIFSKIKEELIKITERKRTSKEKPETPEIPSQNIPNISKTISPDTEKEKVDNARVFGLHGIEILNENEKHVEEQKLELRTTEKPKFVPKEISAVEKQSIMTQKLSAPFQTPAIKTEHTLQNLSSTNVESKVTVNKKPAIDPYREIPE